jgi:predicted secreted acid phosphatase
MTSSRYAKAIKNLKRRHLPQATFNKLLLWLRSRNNAEATSDLVKKNFRIHPEEDLILTLYAEQSKRSQTDITRDHFRSLKDKLSKDNLDLFEEIFDENSIQE